MLVAVVPATLDGGIPPVVHQSEAHVPQGQKPGGYGANEYLAFLKGNLARSKAEAGQKKVLLNRSGGVVALPSDGLEVEKVKDGY